MRNNLLLITACALLACGCHTQQQISTQLPADWKSAVEWCVEEIKVERDYAQKGITEFVYAYKETQSEPPSEAKGNYWITIAYSLERMFIEDWLCSIDYTADTEKFPKSAITAIDCEIIRSWRM